MRRNLKPALTRPADFDVFWHRTSDELGRVDPRIERRVDPTPTPDHLVLERIAYSSLDEARIHGYLLHARDDSPRPLVIHGHGYGSSCELQWHWAEAGLNVLGIDVRGFGRSAAAVPRPSRWGYVLTGIDTPETSVLRGATCDYLRAVRVARDLLGSTTTRFIVHGASFSGALALMSEALLGAADLLVLAVPTFGWAEGRQIFTRSGSGAEISRYLASRPESTEDLMLVLRYFDSMNFADRVRCPTLAGVGLSDDVVPAKTVYAVVNHLVGPHEVMEFPVSHSARPEARLWQAFETRWLKLATEGVPREFGDPSVRAPGEGRNVGEERKVG